MKIKTKADAKAIAEMFVTEDSKIERRYCPGYDAEKPSLHLLENFNPNDIHDESNTSVFMIYIRTEWDGYHRVAFYDDFSGDEWFALLPTNAIADKLWKNRKFINQRGQIDIL